MGRNDEEDKKQGDSKNYLFSDVILWTLFYAFSYHLVLFSAIIGTFSPFKRFMAQFRKLLHFWRFSTL